MVDVRLTLLLYLGSLVGIFIGTYGTKVVKEVMIRMTTGVVIITCVFSRGIAVPVYLRELGLIVFDPALTPSSTAPARACCTWQVRQAC